MRFAQSTEGIYLAKMVAEQQIEIDKMKKRLELLEKDKAEMKEAIDDNHAKFNSKVVEINDKLRQFDEAKLEIIDVLGPKFVEMRSQTDAIINDAQRKFNDIDENMMSISKRAEDRFASIDETIKETESKYHEVNEKAEFLYKAPDQKFKEMTEDMKKTNAGSVASSLDSYQIR